MVCHLQLCHLAHDLLHVECFAQQESTQPVTGFCCLVAILAALACKSEGTLAQEGQARGAGGLHRRDPDQPLKLSKLS